MIGIYIYYRTQLVREIRAPTKILIAKLNTPMSFFKILWAFLEACRILLHLQKYPEPTVENVGNPNTRVFVRIRERFLARLNMHSGYRTMLAWITKGFIIIYDTDFWRPFIDVWANELREAPDWKLPGPRQPDPHFWKEFPNRR